MAKPHGSIICVIPALLGISLVDQLQQIPTPAVISQTYAPDPGSAAIGILVCVNIEQLTIGYVPEYNFVL